ncbi:SsrA-binding protein SmpB [Buchnera aphidicola]|uniref:SsrA-binding protein SmpB n=1 Tax=Buchnera aphidicola TaxID=9 RepID=UPI003463991A
MKNSKKNFFNEIVKNKKIYYDYFVENTFEAGLVLKGWEVKSIRNKSVNITNCRIFFKNLEMYLLGLNINPNYNSDINKNVSLIRNIKVLLKKKEITYLHGKYQVSGYSLVILSLYWKNAWCKIKLAIVKGKKKQDKRLNSKKEEWILQKNKIMKRLLK